MSYQKVFYEQGRMLSCETIDGPSLWVLHFLLRNIRSLRDVPLEFVIPNECKDEVLFASKHFTNEIKVVHKK